MDNSKVIEQYYQLRSCRAVADLYGCSAETIRRILKAEGVSPTGWKQTPEYSKPKKKYYYPYKRRPGFVPTHYEKVCEYCGSKFETRYKGAMFCSRKCKDISLRIAKGISVNPDPKPQKKICAVCGKEYETRRIESLTCSKKCSKRLNNIRNNRRNDRRIPNEQKIDNIQLPILFKRDNGVCYLCGGLCDWNDWRVSDGGNKYPGDNYPTIEHVVPISRGGLDSWENVRLAHWWCNIKKGTKVINA